MTTPAVVSALEGLIDMHCHSGPSPFPRRFDHADAAADGWERLRMRGLVVKSHHHNTQMDVLSMAPRLAATPTRVFGAVALNSMVGGINPSAVDMCLQMGGKVVYFPTISSGRHITCHPEHIGFPTPTVEIKAELVTVSIDGELVPEVATVLDKIAEAGAVLNGGHMHPDDIALVFAAANERGIERMVVSHPDFVIGADPAQCRDLVGLGAVVEHEMHMYDPGAKMQWPLEQLFEWISALGPENTILASDLGQQGFPTPVDAFLRVAEGLLDLGVSEKDLRRMTQDNQAFLLGLDD